jgi:hypothetical protein
MSAAQTALPMPLPKHAAPQALPKPVHCRFCRATIPADDLGLIAWRLCEPCWEIAEFSA